MKVELTVRTPLVSLPDVAFVPLQAPPAVQLVALVEDQFNVVVFPLSTGLVALRVTVGSGKVTVTLAESLAVPPAPVQLRVKVVLAVRVALA